MFYSKVTPVLRVSGGVIVLPQWCSLQFFVKKKDMLHIHLMRVFLGAPRIEPQGQVNSIFLCSIKDEAKKKKEENFVFHTGNNSNILPLYPIKIELHSLLNEYIS